MDNDLLKFGMKAWLISIIIIVIILVTAIFCLASTECYHIPSKGEEWHEQEEASSNDMLGTYCIECREYLGEQYQFIKNIDPENIIPDGINSSDTQGTIDKGRGYGNKGQGGQGKGQGQ